MGWKRAFDEALGELRGARKQLERLDDPTVGLAALHGELSQARMKIQEVVQNGVTGLREEPGHCGADPMPKTGGRIGKDALAPSRT